jgi:DNA-binding IclR family transcriptional regulator
MSREKKTEFRSEQIENFIKICKYLATDPLRPTNIQEIQTALSLTYNKTLWALHAGAKLGWLEQIGDGWRLGPELSRLAEKVRKGIEDEKRRYLGE